MIKLDNKEVLVTHFPDGTQCIKFPYTYASETKCEISWFYDSDEEIFTLASVVDYVKRKYGRLIKIVLNMPYTPNSRMDRIKNISENFSLKVFANLLNSFELDKVIIYNVHSNVSEALINNVESILPNDDVDKAIHLYSPDVIFFPDEGACKRYSDLEAIKKYNKPVAFGIKKRDWKSGKILGLEVVSDIDLKDKKILIVDDIISKGFTFFYAGKKLKELGASSIALYSSHCEDTILDGELLKDESPIDIIYTTDSILHITHEKIHVITKFRN